MVQRGLRSEKSVSLILFISKSGGRAKLKDAASFLNLPRDSTKGYVRALLRLGYLERDGGFLILSEKGRAFASLLSERSPVEPKIPEGVRSKRVKALFEALAYCGGVARASELAALCKESRVRSELYHYVKKGVLSFSFGFFVLRAAAITTTTIPVPENGRKVVVLKKNNEGSINRNNNHDNHNNNKKEKEEKEEKQKAPPNSGSSSNNSSDGVLRERLSELRSPSAVRLFLFLAERAVRLSNYVFYGSAGEVADASGVSLEELNEALRELRNARLAYVIPQAGKLALYRDVGDALIKDHSLILDARSLLQRVS